MRTRQESPEYTLLIRLFEKWESLDVHFAALHLGRDKRNVRKYFKILHAQKLIHISSYSKSQRGPALPIYSIGEGKDVPYPPKLHWRVKHETYDKKKEPLRCLWMSC